jgi:hypothetical protein
VQTHRQKETCAVNTIRDRKKTDKWLVQQYRMNALQESQDDNVNPHSHDKPKVQRRCMIKKTHTYINHIC